MPILRIAKCDQCGHWRPIDAAKEFFMVNVSHVFCSRGCYEAYVEYTNAHQEESR